MKPRISPHDLELLSLYLDEQLSPAERKRLEQHLKENQVLSLALSELRQTRLALRQMPRARLPRNFTLTPQMVGSGSPRRSLPAWGFVSAMASFLFILVLAGDLFGIFTQPTSSVALRNEVAMEAAAPAVENPQEKSVLAAPTGTAIPTETFNVQADEAMKVIAPSAEESNVLSTPAAAATLAEVAPQLEGMTVKGSASPELSRPPEVSASGVVSDTQRASLPTAPPVAESFAQSLESSPTPMETEVEPFVTTGGNDQVTLMRTEERQPFSSSQVILWILEGLFASVAVIAGMILFFQHRKAFDDRR